MSDTAATALNDHIAGLVTRAMRQGGMYGAIKVTHVRSTTTGYSARVVATVGAVRAQYVAKVVGGRVTVRQTVAPAKVA